MFGIMAGLRMSTSTKRYALNDHFYICFVSAKLIQQQRRLIEAPEVIYKLILFSFPAITNTTPKPHVPTEKITPAI